MKATRTCTWAPSVSILLANYNHAHYLPTSLAGICDQTRPADEIIIVDDGSTDQSVQRIEQFAARQRNIRLLKNDRNMGLVFSINKALGAATSDYVVWASSDDLLLPNFLERSLDVLQKYPDAGLCFSQLAVFVEGTSIVRHYTGDKSSGHALAAFDLGNEPHFLSPVQLYKRLHPRYLWMSGNTVVARRDALLEAGGFDPALRWHCDWFSFYVVALRHGACLLPETLAMMRERSNTYSALGMADPRQQRAVLRKMLTVIKTARYRDVLPFFRWRPSLLTPFGLQMLVVAGGDFRHYDIFIPLLLLRVRFFFGKQVSKI